MVKYNVEIVKTENGKGKPTAGLTTALVAESGNESDDGNERENGTTGKLHECKQPAKNFNIIELYESNYDK